MGRLEGTYWKGRLVGQCLHSNSYTDHGINITLHTLYNIVRAHHLLHLGIVGTNDIPNMGVKISQEFQ